jgi:HlyD family secretion protein
MTRQRLIGIGALLALIIAAFVTQGFGLMRTRDDALKLYGNVDIRQVELAFRVPGRIASMEFDEGAKVAPGAILARLDDRPLADSLASAEAQIAQANAELRRTASGNRAQEIARAARLVDEQRALLAKASSDYNRRRSLLPSGAVSQAVVTASKADYEVALARLRQAEEQFSLQRAGSRSEDIAVSRARRDVAVAQAKRTRTDINDSLLTAPEGGTVLTRAQEPGAIVQAGQTVLTMTMDRPMRVRAYIAQTALSRISPGMAVTVTADGNPKTYHGIIGFISPTAEFTPKSVQTESLRADLVYRLRINVSDPDDSLRQAQPVTVAVPSARPPKN